MKIYEELKLTYQNRRGNIITWIVMLVMFTLVLLLDPQDLRPAFVSIWTMPIIVIGSVILILFALVIRVVFPQSFQTLFNLLHYLFVILILSSAIRWTINPENPVYEPMITLFAFFVAVMVYLRQSWGISEGTHEIVELFKGERQASEPDS